MRLEVISRHPPRNARLAPLLFIHGAWHGAWCWAEHFLDYFAGHGFAAHALSLRGHGASEGRSRLRWTRLAEYVADVAQVAGLPDERVRAYGTQAEFFPEMAHDMMLEPGWQAVAKRILCWLEDTVPPKKALQRNMHVRQRRQSVPCKD